MSQKDYDKGYLAGLRDADKIVVSQIPSTVHEQTGLTFLFQPVLDASWEIRERIMQLEEKRKCK